jgi:hypothetical protein
MAIYCEFCGAELLGVKRFCVRCGREQKTRKHTSTVDRKTPESEKVRKKTDEPTEECFRCGGPTERACYFCGKPICNNHTDKMQANILPRMEFDTAKSLGDRKRINNGWRGFIIPTCFRCSSNYEGRPLSPEEQDEIRTLDKCSWFLLAPRKHKYQYE